MKALNAIAQSNFTFLGIARKPGDVISAEELAQTTMSVRDALVSQKAIVLDGVTDSHGDGSIAEKIDHLTARFDTFVETFAKGGKTFQGQIDALGREIAKLKGAKGSSKTTPRAAAEGS